MDIDAVKLMNASPPETRSQIITSSGNREGVDFLKRVFAFGGEDQATGSTYCVLVPYWSSKLHKARMKVQQVSARTGEMEVQAGEDDEDGVRVTGSGVKVMEGRILVDAP